MKCFLIDDDPDDQDFFALALEELPLQTSLQTANNGIEAIDVLKNQASIPDVIFLDINMPRMDGWQCLKEIRGISALNTVPVIMYSTSEYSNGKYPISEDYFVGYLTKQPRINALSEKLSELFEKLPSKQTST